MRVREGCDPLHEGDSMIDFLCDICLLELIAADRSSQCANTARIRNSISPAIDDVPGNNAHIEKVLNRRGGIAKGIIDALLDVSRQAARKEE